MYQNILVPIAFDHDERAETAIKAAKTLVDEGGRVVLLHVLEEIPPFAATYIPLDTMNHSKSEADQKLSELAANAGNGVEATVIWGHAARTILDHAEKIGADCIVIASHKPGLEDYFLGSTAARVVRHAQSTVHVIR